MGNIFSSKEDVRPTPNKVLEMEKECREKRKKRIEKMTEEALEKLDKLTIKNGVKF
tara:strand:- start:18 stop:185 length:168 start_codon:yes stop_codon:yes gene_type:complete